MKRRSFPALAPLLFGLTLSACATVPMQDTPTRAQNADSALPAMKVFTGTRAAAPIRSNTDISNDFLSLFFELESGRSLDRFTRFETPITVRVVGAPPASLNADLSRLLARLRSEAGVDIRRVQGGDADITINAISRAQIRRTLPNAACFVVPNVSDLDDFKKARRAGRTSWSDLETRERMGIFLPADASPQEVRDCLHEELAQAIGPLNDLYRLPDSVFNDDNVHTVLTGFDMLILKAAYAPELHSGMSRAEVAARLPAILSRLNPRGNTVASAPVQPTPRSWIDDVQTALGPGTEPIARRRAAVSAVRTAAAEGWQDHRRAFSYYMLGRMTQAEDPVGAQQYYANALFYLSNEPGTELHRAYVTTQTSAFAIATGDGQAALNQINPVLAIAQKSENAALLATLLLLKSEALDLLGRDAEARAVRLDSLGWARYGFGSDWAVRAKMSEIAALNPSRKTGG